jgi:Secretion system C-terminal sorting domain
MRTHRVMQLAAAIVFLSQTGRGQIVIEESDVQNGWKANTPVRLYSDTSTQVNVGLSGGPNVYDFSSLAFADSMTYTFYSTSEIPVLASRFGQSSLVWGPSKDTIISSVWYFGDSSFNQSANVAVYPDSQAYSYEMIPLLKLPVTYGTQWNRVNDPPLIDSTFVNNVLVYSSMQTGGPKNFLVDGYGTLKFKGQSYDCLRLKETDDSSTYYYRFQYFSKNGPSVIVDGTPSHVDTGVVPIRAIFCISHPGVSTYVPAQHLAPVTFSLAQNYPNPFNPTTMINYQLAVNSFVTLKVFDILGREIKSLVNEHQTAGAHSVAFDASTLASGVYFYTMEAGEFVQTRKLVLLK